MDKPKTHLLSQEILSFSSNAVSLQLVPLDPLFSSLFLVRLGIFPKTTYNMSAYFRILHVHILNVLTVCSQCPDSKTLGSRMGSNIANVLIQSIYLQFIQIKLNVSCSCTFLLQCMNVSSTFFFLSLLNKAWDRLPHLPIFSLYAL